MHILLSFVFTLLVPVLFLWFHYSVSLWPLKGTDTEKNWWAIPLSVLIVLALSACFFLALYFASLT